MNVFFIDTRTTKPLSVKGLILWIRDMTRLLRGKASANEKVSWWMSCCVYYIVNHMC